MADLVEYDNTLSPQTRPEFLRFLVDQCKVWVAKTRNEAAANGAADEEKEKLRPQRLFGGGRRPRARALRANGRDCQHAARRLHPRDACQNCKRARRGSRRKSAVLGDVRHFAQPLASSRVSAAHQAARHLPPTHARGALQRQVGANLRLQCRTQPFLSRALAAHNLNYPPLGHRAASFRSRSSFSWLVARKRLRTFSHPPQILAQNCKTKTNKKAAKICSLSFLLINFYSRLCASLRSRLWQSRAACSPSDLCKRAKSFMEQTKTRQKL